ncbi:hypothetical protein [Rhizobium rhizogenes]|uniref:hypothetical protein n=1 Tax=Rhizobium rhizogenes TaxID=359 RepID=UPI0015737553|nr:hypothetical protein [Rhizobium rhizogenes]NTF43092.1 hypothetical protein [Rhizobium rhizogenes]
MHNPEIEDALGAALSFLHALKLGIDSCDALGGGGRDYCAFHLLVDSAQAGVSRALNIFDGLGDDDPQAVENHPVNSVDNGGN